MTEETKDIERMDEPWTVKLSPASFFATKEKLDKINARAAKRGFTGRFELVYERKVETVKNGILPVEMVWYESHIVGEAPKYEGWKFLARVDALPGSDAFTIATAPGVENIDRSIVRLGECDHCKKRRYRKNIYLVQGEAGGILQVGSTCIKDFLGWNATFCWLSAEDAHESLFGSYGYQEPVYTVKSVLAAAHLAIREFGWVKSRDDFATSTKVHMQNILEPPMWHKDETDADRERRLRYLKLEAMVPEAMERVPAIIEWIRSLDDSSNFNQNLKACIEVDEVTRRQLGLLAYAPEGYARHLGKEAEWKVRQAQHEADLQKSNEFIGEVGDRIEVEGTVRAVRSFEGMYGVTTLYTVETEAGLVKWFASGKQGWEANDWVRFKGTVKKHEVFNEVKSTVLTRCKEVAWERADA